MLKVLLLTIIVLIEHITPKTYTCQFGTLYKDLPSTPNLNDKPDQLLDPSHHIHNRHLQTLVRSPIRITLDTTNFNTIATPTNGQASTTTTKLNFIKKSMLLTQYFYEQRLKVSTIARVFAPATCVDYTTPNNDVSNGISSSDLHIYVRHLTNQNLAYGATGKSCKWVTSRSLPDPTLQQGRPTVGLIKFNTYKIIDQETTLTNRLFAQITATCLHQVMHILGFDYSLYSTFLDSTTNNVYAGGIIASTLLHASRGGNHNLMTSPKVKAWARQHYQCPTLAGMALQNQEGTGNVGSHWQRTSIYDQLMTATQLGAQKGFSALSFALLKDMGWYQVDDTFNETTNYGYHKGCPFFNDACYGAVYDKYFCDVTAYTDVSECSTTFMGKAICTNQANIMADGCGIFGSYMPCVDPAQSGDSYKPYTLQKYQTSSFCVESTFANVGISSKYRGRCYPYTCSTDLITFTIGTYTLTCTPAQAGTQKSINSLSGYLQCPDYQAFCKQSRKICKNWCSGNGFCTRGICNCYKGYYGQDCSRTSCSVGQYWDQSTSQCVASCPSGTYQNQYSKACQYCSSECSQCRDQPTICSGCLSTPAQPLYFYVTDSTCLQECPSTTYLGGDNCYDCQITPARCQTCGVTATNCTSCSSAGSAVKYFLQNPDWGTCVTTCTAPNTVYDIVNFQCTETCTQNLKYYPGTDPCADCPAGYIGFCDLCPDGQYKLISDQQCHTQCPSRYYQDQARRFCENCHGSCLQCDGPYAENCTQCSSSSSLNFLLLKMCVSSCPRGFYPNQADGTCQICPISSNCATCQLNPSLVIICLTCKYGYFLQADQTCKQTCPQYHYPNKWNRTCDSCSPNCGDCTTVADSSCTNCRNPKLFLANISGGFCLNACPTQLYTQSGSNCLECYSTCQTCDGVSSQSCQTCKQGYYLYNGMCRYVCPAGTYQNTETRTCQVCDGSCTFCFGATIDNCTACISNLVLDNFTCAVNCSSGLTVNQWGVCYERYMGVFVVFLLLLLGVMY